MSTFDVTTIYMTQGVPASGKTTWARQKLKDENNIKRICKDDLRDMLDNGKFSMKNERYILDMRNEMVESALLRGNDVILDDTNFSDDHWKAMRDIAKRVGNVKVVEIYFEVSLKEARRRNENRDENEKVPEHIIEDMFERHVRGGTSVSQREEFFPEANHPHNQTQTENLTESFIVDLDGTLALNNSGREYNEFLRVKEDDPNIPIVRMVQELYEDYEDLIIVTGRSEECRKECREWLNVFEVPFNLLYMRGEHDTRRDTDVKKEIYFDEIHENNFVNFVIDDRMSVVNMWRSLGIPTLQVSKGTF